MNQEVPDVQAGFRKGRGTRDQIASIHWIREKAREFQKNCFCFIDYPKAFDCMDHNKLEKLLRYGNTRPPYLPPETSVCRSRSNSYNWTWNNGLVPNWEEYIKAVHCHPAYLHAEYIMWNARLDESQLESRFMGEISITSDMQMTPRYGKKRRGTKEPFDKDERGEWKVGLKLNI